MADETPSEQLSYSNDASITLPSTLTSGDYSYPYSDYSEQSELEPVSRRAQCKPLIISTFSVIFGLAGVGLLFLSTFTGAYYKSVCEDKNLKVKTLALTNDTTCEEMTEGSYEQCLWAQHFYDKGSRRYPEDERPQCPPNFLMLYPMYVAAMFWVLSLLTLVVVGVVRKTCLWVFKCGGFMNLCVGGVLILCALCIGAFFGWLLFSNIWCGEEMEKQGIMCDDKNEKFYQPWILLAGAGLVGVAGILNLVTGVVMNRLVQFKDEDDDDGKEDESTKIETETDQQSGSEVGTTEVESKSVEVTPVHVHLYEKYAQQLAAAGQRARGARDLAL